MLGFNYFQPKRLEGCTWIFIVNRLKLPIAITWRLAVITAHDDIWFELQSNCVLEVVPSGVLGSWLHLVSAHSPWKTLRLHLVVNCTLKDFTFFFYGRKLDTGQWICTPSPMSMTHPSCLDHVVWITQLFVDGHWLPCHSNPSFFRLVFKFRIPDCLYPFIPAFKTLLKTHSCRYSPVCTPFGYLRSKRRAPADSAPTE
jgi:hypothetical protein